jgi:hypothetical protein
MKKILIVGDSNTLGEWGTIIPGPSCANPKHPELFRPYNKEQYLYGDHPKGFQVVWPGFGYNLDLMGHATANYGIGGGSNFEALFKVEEALGLAPCFTSPAFYNPDVIVWVVTEPCRDLGDAKWPPEAGLYDLEKYYKQRDNTINDAKSIKELNDMLLKIAMDGAQRIYNETNIPWIIIEGWSKVDIKNYTFAKHVVKDWMATLLGHDIPLLSSWPTVNHLRRRRPDLTENAGDSLRLFARQKPELNIPKLPEGNQEDTEFKLIVDDYEEVIKTMQQHDKFPDNCHPDRTVHAELAEHLELIINGLQK